MFVIRNYSDSTGWHTSFYPILPDGSLGQPGVDLDKVKLRSVTKAQLMPKDVKLPTEKSWEYTLVTEHRFKLPKLVV
jgi:hypothetical protein